jgi:hypothetical protein
MSKPKILYDYKWLQIVQTVALADKTNTPHKWKVPVNQYHIEINGKMVSEIPFEDIPQLVQSLERIVSDSRAQGFRDGRKPEPSPIPLIAEPVTDELPFF